jgi:drug/metabolite transporter (DMT)-like permease
MSFGLGVAAALGAPFVMTIGFIIWENHWRGSAFSLNMFKCNLASLGFLVLSLTTRSGELFPSLIFTTRAVGYLMLSSTIGILIGDLTWLEGLHLLGARRVILVDAIKPFLAALFGWAILGESLRPPAFGGMALTVVGVLIVSLETEKGDNSDNEGSDGVTGSQDFDPKKADVVGDPLLGVDDSVEPEGKEMVESIAVGNVEPQGEVMVKSIAVPFAVAGQEGNEVKNKASTRLRLTPARLRRGYVLTALNVVLDTYGSLLTKEHGVGMTTWEINLIRFGFAAIVMLLLSVVLHLRHWVVNQMEMKKGNCDPTDEEDKNNKTSQIWYSLPRNMKRKSWLQVSMGVLFVTFFTPALSNYALFQIALALALTLGSVGPLYSLPLTWLLQHDRPTFRACAGGLLAVAGIIVLSFWGKQ